MSIKDKNLIIEIEDKESGEKIESINYLDYIDKEKGILIPANMEIYIIDKAIRKSIKEKRNIIINVK